jgi:hypothetical protein
MVLRSFLVLRWNVADLDLVCFLEVASIVFTVILLDRQGGIHFH